MVEIDFTVVGAEPVLASVSPAIELELEIKCSTRVAGALVRAQVRIEAAKRSYDSSETERLRILFGARRDWHRTLKSVLWTQIALPVPAFENTTRVPISLPLCHDFSAAVTQYVQGLESGTLPLSIVFSGMVFVEAADGALRAEPISWASEARYELPLSVARAAIERHYAGSVPLWLEKDTVERLFAFRAQHGLTSFEGALDRLLASGGRSE